MIFANYARKSVFRDNSDSLKNQERMAQEYAQLHFPGKVDDFRIYSDEDYSGANTHRPDLQRMLHDIENNDIDVLIVYQLDRLSRDIRDFSNIYSILDEHNVQFVSVKENIDTTTPIGKAMMYITVVFAQMERETIANRVTDNMITLARDGWWVGGNPPVGYRRKRITAENGRNHVTLEIVPEEAAANVRIFEQFLSGHYTISSFQTYCRRQNILTAKGYVMTTSQIYKLLTSPYCVPATQEIYDYFSRKGCRMMDDRSHWTGEYGVMVYGRSTERGNTHTLTSPDNWIVCVGHHKPYISVDMWLSVQNRFGKNVFDRTTKYEIPLLKGILRCKCGRLCGMSRKKKVDGSISTWYRCPRKNQDSTACDMKEIKIELLDNTVLGIFQEISIDDDKIYNYINSPSRPSTSPDEIQRKIDTISRKIERMAESLALAEGGTAARYIIAQIEKLDLEKQSLSQELYSVSKIQKNYKQSITNVKSIQNQIRTLLKDFDNYTDIERNNIAREIIKECVWDGETLRITL